jgi:small subunit ribosomal protein S6
VRTYEALYIVRPDIEDDEVQTVAKRVEELVTNHGGSIVRSEIWGKRKLAYPVKKFIEGNYVLLRFEADGGFIAELEESFRLNENVIRDLVVYFDDKMLALEAEQARRKQAEVQASAERAEREGRSDDRDRDRDRDRRRRRDDDDDDD